METKDFMPSEAVIAGIKTVVETYEAERAKAHRQVRWRVPVFLGLLFIVAAVLAFAFNSFANPYEQWLSTPHVFLYLGTFAVSFLVYSAAMSPATKLRQSLRDWLLPVIFGFVEDVRYANGKTPDSFDRLPKQAVGSFNRKHFDDIVSGRYEGFPFELYETTLAQKSGKSSARTVFKGVVTAFETETPFPGVLVAAKRAGKVSKFFRGLFGGGGLETITSEIASLDEAYEFHTDNPSAARPLASGKLAKALQWLNETWPGEPARVALNGRDGFLLLPHAKNFFEVPDISTPIDYKTHVAPMVADMVALLVTAALVRKVGGPDEEGVGNNPA